MYDCDVVREMRLGVCFVNVGERDSSTIAVFIPFQEEAYISSAAGRVMLRVTSVMFEIVRLCSSELWKFREYKRLP